MTSFILLQTELLAVRSLVSRVTGNTVLCDKSGKLSEYLTSSTDFAEQSIEPLPNYDRSVSRYFGFETLDGEPKGRSNLLQMILRQVVLASRDSDYQGEQKARLWREYVGIHYTDSSLAIKAEITVNGRILAATEENTLALALINQIKGFEELAATTEKALAEATTDEDKAKHAYTLKAVNKKLARDRLVVTYLPVLY